MHRLSDDIEKPGWIFHQVPAVSSLLRPEGPLTMRLVRSLGKQGVDKRSVSRVAVRRRNASHCRLLKLELSKQGVERGGFRGKAMTGSCLFLHHGRILLRSWSIVFTAVLISWRPGRLLAGSEHNGVHVAIDLLHFTHDSFKGSARLIDKRHTGADLTARRGAVQAMHCLCVDGTSPIAQLRT